MTSDDNKTPQFDASFAGKNQKGILERRPEKIIGVNFDSQVEIQTNRFKASKMVQISNYASATASVANGTRAVVTAALNPNTNYLNNFLLGMPFISIYEGTASVGSMEFYPSQGAGIASGRWNAISGFDYQNTFNGTNVVYSVTIWHTAGTPLNIFVEDKYKYMQNNGGKSS